MSLPNFFLSEYISASLPLEKYILSNEHALVSVFLLIFLIDTFPLFFIIIALPGSSSLILFMSILNAF